MGGANKGRTAIGLAGAAAAGLAAASAYALRYRLDDEARAIRLLGDDYLDPSREPARRLGPPVAQPPYDGVPGRRAAEAQVEEDAPVDRALPVRSSR